MKTTNKITTVRNLLNSSDENVYVNNHGPVENMINEIICRKKQTGQLLDKTFRDKIRQEYNLIERISKNGDLICFCEKLDLFSRQTQKTY